MRLQNDSYGWVLVRGLAVRDEEGWAVRVAGSVTDLAQRGLFDALTGLPNRTLFVERLGCALEKSERQPEESSAVLFLDLNRFKIINDSLGHQVGDLLLVEVARRLQLCVRSVDTVARFGGDEFVILLEGLETSEGLRRILDRLERYIATTYELGGHQVVNSASIGVVADFGLYDSVEAVLRDVDIAMYHAKGMKRPYVFFDQAMHEKAKVRQEIEVELREALERDEFFLAYQPIVSLLSGEVHGVKALVRWRHPRRGLVSPGEFIPVAEETGLIVPLGEWVLREACHQMSLWQQNRVVNAAMTVSVNVSSKQLLQAGLAERVKAILQQTGLEPQRLKIEVTESAVIDDPDLAATVLTQLREHGIGISVDDFGTGYSSLRYIHNLPVNTLKVDQSFVQKMRRDPKSHEIVRTVVGLALNLHADIVAEGVETVEQLGLLRQLGCQYGQGYLFSRPVALEEAMNVQNFNIDAATLWLGGDTLIPFQRLLEPLL